MTEGKRGGRPAWPFWVLLVLVSGVWLSALLPWQGAPRRAEPRRPHVRRGPYPEQAEAIRQSPRALVYVDAPTSVPAAVGRQRFLEAALELSKQDAAFGVESFILDETDP